MKKINHYFLILGLLFITGCTSTMRVSTPSTTTELPVKQITAPALTSTSTPTAEKMNSTLKRAKQENGLVYYDGTIRVTGTYTYYPPNTGILYDVICFNADKKTGYLIPREIQMYGEERQLDNRNPWFCFSNQKEAEAALSSTQSVLNPKCNSGDATIEISNYVVNLSQSEVYDTAKLEKVILKTPEQGC